MSAAEIIEQIKALPEEERQQVAAYLKAVNHAPDSARETHQLRVRRAADAVFRKHDEALRRLAQ